MQGKVILDLCSGYQSWAPVAKRLGCTYVAIDLLGDRNVTEHRRMKLREVAAIERAITVEWPKGCMMMELGEQQQQIVRGIEDAGVRMTGGQGTELTEEEFTDRRVMDVLCILP